MAAGAGSAARSAISPAISRTGRRAAWRAPASSRSWRPGSPWPTPASSRASCRWPGLVLGSHWGDFHSSETFARGFLERGALGPLAARLPEHRHERHGGPGRDRRRRAGADAHAERGGRGGRAGRGARRAPLIAAGRARAVLAGGSDEISRDPLPRAGPAGHSCRPTEPGTGGLLAVRPPGERHRPGRGRDVPAPGGGGGRRRARGARVYAELAGAAWGNLLAPAHGFPAAAAARSPGASAAARRGGGWPRTAIEVAYLTGSGHPAHDACELDLVARALPAGRARLTALTPLVGEHAGLGALRVAAAALAVAGCGGARAAGSLGAGPSGSPVRHGTRPGAGREVAPADGAGARPGAGWGPRRPGAPGLRSDRGIGPAGGGRVMAAVWAVVPVFDEGATLGAVSSRRSARIAP